MPSSADALVVGGGPAGAMVAALLAGSGRTVEVIERTSAPHDKVCGEFLSAEAMTALRMVGLDASLLGAVPIRTVRVVTRRILAERRLPFPAMSLTRKVMDEALLQRAEALGTTVLRGHRVDSLSPAPNGWSARLQEGEQRSARAAFLATGKHDLHGSSRRAGRQQDLVAFKMYFLLSEDQRAALEGSVELILFPGGYTGLQLVEGGKANLCVLVQQQVLRGMGASWMNLLEHMQTGSAHLATRLAGATPLLAKPLALSSIPYGHLPSRSDDGLWRLGDQAGVIPSFTGCGMSLALHSARVAAQSYLDGEGAEQFAQRLRRQVRGPVRLATMLSQAMIVCPVLVTALQWCPGLLGTIARHTRMPLNPSTLAASVPAVPRFFDTSSRRSHDS